MSVSSDALIDFKRESLRGAPGYFRVGLTQVGQWWMVDPADRPFFARAVHGVAATPEAVHDPAARLRQWGFNTLGCGSERLYQEEGMAFLRAVGFAGTGPVINLAGVRLPDVFDADWPRAVDERARAVCEPLAENRHLLGWVTDDVPGWPTQPAVDRPGLLQVCLSLEPGLAVYHAAWEFVLALHGSKLPVLAKAWGVTLTNKEALRDLTRREQGLVTRGYLRDEERWSQEFAQRYFTTTVAAIRRHAPHHLVLGCRWGGPVSATLRSACAAVADICLIDHTELPGVPTMPVLLGDFNWSTKAFWEEGTARRLLGPTTLERMLRRGRLGLARAVAHPAVVGYAWSRWHDRAGEQAPFGSGLVHANENEAREHTELLTAINDRVEELRAMTLYVEDMI
ncbi:MAG: hypothetical protein K9N23_15295 [Akkermansiaceae bacterium]|nr:hypothetical protein [Akkermansiaceae bacterium]